MVHQTNDVKNMLDLMSVGAALGSAAQILPTVAAVASLVWTTIRIGEWVYLKIKKRHFNPLDH